jgi:hypothetical protein
VCGWSEGVLEGSEGVLDDSGEVVFNGVFKGAGKAPEGLM